MKSTLRKLFEPILNYFETDTGDYVYKPSHRRILIVVGALFLLLSLGGVFVSLKASLLGGIFPIFVFFTVGMVCEVVGWLGSDKAVAKIWKSR